MAYVKLSYLEMSKARLERYIELKRKLELFTSPTDTPHLVKSWWLVSYRNDSSASPEPTEWPRIPLSRDEAMLALNALIEDIKIKLDLLQIEED